MRRKRTTPLKDDQINLGSCSTELRARILSNAPYFRGLPQPAIDAVNGLFRSVSHPAGTALYHEGEPVQALFLVAHGTVKLLQHSEQEAAAAAVAAEPIPQPTFVVPNQPSQQQQQQQFVS